MIADTYIRWIATAAFVVTGLFWVWQGTRRGGSIVGYGCAAWHVLMALGMLVMLQPRWPQPSNYAGMAIFAGGAVFFLAATALRVEHRGANLYHAAMMASMVWMYAVMEPRLVGATHTMAGGDAAESSGHHHGGGGGAGQMSMELPGWAGAINLAVGLGYLVVTAVAVGLYYRRRAANPAGNAPLGDGHDHRLAGAMTATMAFGMAISFLSMA